VCRGLQLLLVDHREFERLGTLNKKNCDIELNKIRVSHPENPRKALLSAGRNAVVDEDSRRLFLPLTHNGRTNGTSICLPDIAIDGMPMASGGSDALAVPRGPHTCKGTRAMPPAFKPGQVLKAALCS
jgi:hypothetical protein